MKMSDVFDNRDITSRNAFIADRDIERSSLGAFNTNAMAHAAAHAINHHDALVAMNAELVEALTSLAYGNNHINNMAARSRAKETLAKAKELSQ